MRRPRQVTDSPSFGNKCQTTAGDQSERKIHFLIVSDACDKISRLLICGIIHMKLPDFLPHHLRCDTQLDDSVQIPDFHFEPLLFLPCGKRLIESVTLFTRRVMSMCALVLCICVTTMTPAHSWHANAYHLKRAVQAKHPNTVCCLNDLRIPVK
jgi:hypothetical protein